MIEMLDKIFYKQDAKKMYMKKRKFDLG